MMRVLQQKLEAIEDDTVKEVTEIYCDYRFSFYLDSHLPQRLGINSWTYT